MEWSELPGLFPGLPDAGRWLPLLERHATILKQAETHTRVTSVAPEDAVRRQYAESLEIWRIAVEATGADPAQAVDVGSGGGFPGLVMACAAPRTNFVLVEPLQKRARLLEDAALLLGLENVQVLGERAEDAGRGPGRGSASLVTARAVANLSELLEYTAPFAAPGGSIASAKGSGWEAELRASERAQALLSTRFVRRVAMRPAISENVSVLLFEQEREVGPAYPRRAGIPHRRPL
jgi:16S rRNA (guanine527-N7)-methyltransferase